MSIVHKWCVGAINELVTDENKTVVDFVKHSVPSCSIARNVAASYPPFLSALLTCILPPSAPFHEFIISDSLKSIKNEPKSALTNTNKIGPVSRWTVTICWLDSTEKTIVILQHRFASPRCELADNDYGISTWRDACDTWVDRE